MRILAVILGASVLFGAAQRASADLDVDPIRIAVCSGDPDRVVNYYDQATGNLVCSGTAASICAYMNANYAYLLAGTGLCAEKADKTCLSSGAACTHPIDGAGQCETKLISGATAGVFKRCRCTKQSQVGGAPGPFLSVAPLLLLALFARRRKRATNSSVV